jgi:hypothetical protein
MNSQNDTQEKRETKMRSESPNITTISSLKSSPSENTSRSRETFTIKREVRAPEPPTPIILLGWFLDSVYRCDGAAMAGCAQGCAQATANSTGRTCTSVKNADNMAACADGMRRCDGRDIYEEDEEELKRGQNGSLEAREPEERRKRTGSEIAPGIPTLVSHNDDDDDEVSFDLTSDGTVHMEQQILRRTAAMKEAAERYAQRVKRSREVLKNETAIEQSPKSSTLSNNSSSTGRYTGSAQTQPPKENRIRKWIPGQKSKTLHSESEEIEKDPNNQCKADRSSRLRLPQRKYVVFETTKD